MVLTHFTILNFSLYFNSQYKIIYFNNSKQLFCMEYSYKKTAGGGVNPAANFLFINYLL